MCQALSQVLHLLQSILWHFYPEALLVLFFEPFSNLCCFSCLALFRQLSYLATRIVYVVIKRPWFKSQSCHWKVVWTWANYLIFRTLEHMENAYLMEVFIKLHDKVLVNQPLQCLTHSGGWAIVIMLLIIILSVPWKLCVIHFCTSVETSVAPNLRSIFYTCDLSWRQRFLALECDSKIHLHISLTPFSIFPL